jgi:membrane protein implicated in regulation of membrane protease activity
MSLWQWFTELTGVEKFFVLCAAIGAVLFSIRLVLMFAGMGETDADLDADVDVDADVGAHVDADTAGAGEISGADFSFKILSFQGLTAFFTMFGLVGLAMMRGSRLSAGWAILGGMGAGLFSVWVVSWLFTFFKRLQHSGTLSLKNAVGQEGKVYLSIPGDAPGKVQVSVQGRLGIFDAISEDKSNIPTDTVVKVVGLSSANLLVVRKV